MLEIDANITGVITHALTAIQVLQKQPRLINWKSPFNGMTREDLDRFAAVDVSSVRQNNELLDMIQQAVSSFFEKNVSLFESSRRRINYFVSPDDEYRQPAIIETIPARTYSPPNTDANISFEQGVSSRRLQVRNILYNTDDAYEHLRSDVDTASKEPDLSLHTNRLRVALVAGDASLPSTNQSNTDVNIASEGPDSSSSTNPSHASQVAREHPDLPVTYPCRAQTD